MLTYTACIKTGPLQKQLNMSATHSNTELVICIFEYMQTRVYHKLHTCTLTCTLVSMISWSRRNYGKMLVKHESNCSNEAFVCLQ